MVKKSRFGHVITDLRKSADNNRDELIKLLEVRNRDYALMNRILDRYIEYVNAADVLQQKVGAGDMG